MKKSRMRILAAGMSLAMTLPMVPADAVSAYAGGEPAVQAEQQTLREQSIEIPLSLGEVSLLEYQERTEEMNYLHLGVPGEQWLQAVLLDPNTQGPLTTQPAGMGRLELVDSRQKVVAASEETGTYGFWYGDVTANCQFRASELKGVAPGEYTLRFSQADVVYPCQDKVTVLNTDALLLKMAHLERFTLGSTAFDVKLNMVGAFTEEDLAGLKLELLCEGVRVGSGTGKFRSTESDSMMGWFSASAQVLLDEGRSLEQGKHYTLKVGYTGSKLLVNGIEKADSRVPETGMPQSELCIDAVEIRSAQTARLGVAMSGLTLGTVYQIRIQGTDRNSGQTEVLAEQEFNAGQTEQTVDVALTRNGIGVTMEQLQQIIMVHVQAISPAGGMNGYYELENPYFREQHHGGVWLQSQYISIEENPLVLTFGFQASDQSWKDGTAVAAICDLQGRELCRSTSAEEIPWEEEGTTGSSDMRGLRAVIPCTGLTDGQKYGVYLNGDLIQEVTAVAGICGYGNVGYVGYEDGIQNFWLNFDRLPVSAEYINTSGSGQFLIRDDTGADVVTGGVVQSKGSEGGMNRYEHQFTGADLSGLTSGSSYTFWFRDHVTGDEVNLLAGEGNPNPRPLHYDSAKRPLSFQHEMPWDPVAVGATEATLWLDLSQRRNMTAADLETLKQIRLENMNDHTVCPITGFRQVESAHSSIYSYPVTLTWAQGLTEGEYQAKWSNPAGGEVLIGRLSVMGGTEEKDEPEMLQIDSIDPLTGDIYGEIWLKAASLSGQVFRGYDAVTEKFPLENSGKSLHFDPAVLAELPKGRYSLRVTDQGRILGEGEMTLLGGLMPVLTINDRDGDGEDAGDPVLHSAETVVKLKHADDYPFLRAAESREELTAAAFGRQANFFNYTFRTKDGPATLFVELSRTGKADDRDNLILPLPVRLCTGPYDLQVPPEIDGVIPRDENNFCHLSATLPMKEARVYVRFLGEQDYQNQVQQMQFAGLDENGRARFELNVDPDVSYNGFRYADTRRVEFMAADLSNRYNQTTGYQGNLRSQIIDRDIRFDELAQATSLEILLDGKPLEGQYLTLEAYEGMPETTHSLGIRVLDQLGREMSGMHTYWEAWDYTSVFDASTGTITLRGDVWCNQYNLVARCENGPTTNIWLSVVQPGQGPNISNLKAERRDNGAFLSWECIDTTTDHFVVTWNGRSVELSAGDRTYLAEGVKQPADFTVFAVNGSGMSGNHMTVHFEGDSQPPTIPYPQENADTVSVTLTWEPSTDNVGVDHYELSYQEEDREDAERKVIELKECTYTFRLFDKSLYHVELRAVDAAGNRSEPGEISVLRPSVFTLTYDQVMTYDRNQVPMIDLDRPGDTRVNLEVRADSPYYDQLSIRSANLLVYYREFGIDEWIAPKPVEGGVVPMEITDTPEGQRMLAAWDFADARPGCYFLAAEGVDILGAKSQPWTFDQNYYGYPRMIRVDVVRGKPAMGEVKASVQMNMGQAPTLSWTYDGAVGELERFSIVRIDGDGNVTPAGGVDAKNPSWTCQVSGIKEPGDLGFYIVRAHDRFGRTRSSNMVKVCIPTADAIPGTYLFTEVRGNTIHYSWYCNGDASQVDHFEMTNTQNPMFRKEFPVSGDWSYEITQDTPPVRIQNDQVVAVGKDGTVGAALNYSDYTDPRIKAPAKLELVRMEADGTETVVSHTRQIFHLPQPGQELGEEFRYAVRAYDAQGQLMNLSQAEYTIEHGGTGVVHPEMDYILAQTDSYSQLANLVELKVVWNSRKDSAKRPEHVTDVRLETGFTFSVVPARRGPAVTGLKAVHETDSVVLTWECRDTTVDHYIVRWGDQQVSVSGNLNTYTIPNWTQRGKFSVQAVSKDGLLGKPAECDTGDKVPPTSPANLKLLSRTTTTLTIGWDPASDDSGRVLYRVYYGSPDSGAMKELVVDTCTATLDMGVYHDGGITIWVWAEDEAGNQSPVEERLHLKADLLEYEVNFINTEEKLVVLKYQEPARNVLTFEGKASWTNWPEAGTDDIVRLSEAVLVVTGYNNGLYEDRIPAVVEGDRITAAWNYDAVDGGTYTFELSATDENGVGMVGGMELGKVSVELQANDNILPAIEGIIVDNQDAMLETAFTGKAGVPVHISVIKRRSLFRVTEVELWYAAIQEGGAIGEYQLAKTMIPSQSGQVGTHQFCDGEWDISALADGRYSLKVVARDDFGNEGEKTGIMEVDHTPPLPVLDLKADNSSAGVLLTWAYPEKDDAAEHWIHREFLDGTGRLHEEQFEIHGRQVQYYDCGNYDLPDGTEVTYYMVSVDHAGNESQSEKITCVFHRDITAPVIESFQPADGTSQSKFIDFEVTASDDYGLGRLTIYIRPGWFEGGIWEELTSLYAPDKPRNYVYRYQFNVNEYLTEKDRPDGRYEFRLALTDQYGVNLPDDELVTNQTLFAELERYAMPGVADLRYEDGENGGMLRWTATGPVGARKEIRIYRTNRLGEARQLVATLAPDAVEYPVTAEPGRTAWYVVQVADRYGEVGEFGSPVCVTRIAKPALEAELRGEEAWLIYHYPGDCSMLSSAVLYRETADGQSIPVELDVSLKDKNHYVYVYKTTPGEVTGFRVDLTDLAGSKMSTGTVTVQVPDVDTEAPLAVIFPQEVTAAVGETVVFTSINSTDNVGVVRGEWDFGDNPDGAEPFQGISASHVYRRPGVYTVTMSVFDSHGNRGTTTAAVTVTDPLDRTNGTLAVRVTDGSKPVAGAEVILKGKDAIQAAGRGVTNAEGVATLVVPAGRYTAAVSAGGFGPAEAVVKLAAGQQAEAVLTLKTIGAAAGQTASTLLTPEQMEQAGIDPTEPGNQEVRKVETTLSVKTAGKTVELPVSHNCNSNGDLVGQSTGYGWTAVPDTSLSVGVFPVSEYFVLVIYGQAHWFGESFRVELIQLEHSGAETVTDCSAVLELPEGLSLAPMASGAQTARIELGTAGQAAWMVRGDVEGQFTLRTAVSGVMTGSNGAAERFHRTVEAETHVYGGQDLHLFAEAEDVAYAGEEYHVGLRLENWNSVSLERLAFGISGAKQFRVAYQPEGGETVTLTQEDFNQGRTILIPELKAAGSVRLDFYTSAWFAADAGAVAMGPTDIQELLEGIFITSLEGSSSPVTCEVQLKHIPHSSFYERNETEIPEGNAELDVLAQNHQEEISMTEDSMRAYQFDAGGDADSTVVIVLDQNGSFSGEGAPVGLLAAEDAIEVSTDAARDRYTISSDGRTMTIRGSASIFVRSLRDGTAQLKVTTHAGGKPLNSTLSYTVDSKKPAVLSKLFLQTPALNEVEAPEEGYVRKVDFKWYGKDQLGNMLAGASGLKWEVTREGQPAKGVTAADGGLLVDHTALPGKYEVRLVSGDVISNVRTFTVKEFREHFSVELKEQTADHVTVTVSNLDGRTNALTVILAGYDADGRMMTRAVDTRTLADQQAMELTLALNGQDGVTGFRAFVLKAGTNTPVRSAWSK